MQPVLMLNTNCKSGFDGLFHPMLINLPPVVDEILETTLIG